MSRAVIYLRVSTKDQAKRGGEAEGFSIPAQREACTRKAEQLGAEVTAEFIDHGATDRLYPDTRRADDQREAAADYFAACLLMPRRLVKQAWGRRIQRIPDLAAHFQVSEQSMKYRVDQLRLTDHDHEPARRCAPPRARATRQIGVPA